MVYLYMCVFVYVCREKERERERERRERAPDIIAKKMKIRSAVYNPLCNLDSTSSTQHHATWVVRTIMEQTTKPGVFACNWNYNFLKLNETIQLGALDAIVTVCRYLFILTWYHENLER